MNQRFLKTLQKNAVPDHDLNDCYMGFQKPFIARQFAPAYAQYSYTDAYSKQKSTFDYTTQKKSNKYSILSSERDAMIS